MASDSATAGTVTPTQEPLENNKVNEEAKLMEKETVLLENADVVEDKPASDSNLTDQIEQTHAKEPEKESPEAAEKSEESTEKGEDEKVAEQVELKEEILVKECVKEKPTMESVTEELNKEKEETKIVDVSESTDEAKEKQVESVDLQAVTDGFAETEEVQIKDVEPAVSTDVKTETTEAKTLEVELNPEAKTPPEVEVKAVENPELPEVEVKAVEKPELPEVETQVKGSETNSTPEKVVSTNQDSDIEPKKETKEDAIEKIIAEEKHVMEEPSKDEKVSEAIDVITKLATEPATDGKTEENLKEPATESKEKEISDKKQEESVTEKVAEAATEPIKEEPEITVKEVAVKQKHSNSIISKVKQSFVKAKKAIIGKSPSSKTISTEAEGEIKVK